MDNFNKGIVLICSSQGFIIKCLEDNIGIAGQFPAGKKFLSSFNQACFNKALDFIIDLKSKKHTFNWEFDYPVNGGIDTLLFGGGYLGDDIAIIISKETGYAENKFNELVNEYKLSGNDFSDVEEESFEPDVSAPAKSFLNELNRLNNQIVKYQREISTKNKELAKLNEIKNQFLGMAAHDLRNPLGNIRSYCEFLLDDEDDISSEHLEYIRNIKSLSNFMIGMVNDLLDISSIESGKLKLEKEEVDFVELIQNAIRLNHLLAEKKNIVINFTSETNKFLIRLDKRKISQVLTNLLSNAVKYSFPDRKIFVNMTYERYKVLVSVKDEGQGIPVEDLPNLFKPFHKSSVQSTAGEKSTGLGLVIVRKIVEAHSGDITVESEKGKGSSFTFSLPTTE